MRKRRLVFALFAVVLLGGVLSGCASGGGGGVEDGGDNVPATHYTFYQDVPNGGQVLCVWAKSGYGGGLSCDWDGYYKDRETGDQSG